MTQLTCENITLAYEGRTVVSGLSFTVSSGDYLCVVGENGSGKSTLLQAILKQKAPASGSIELCGGLERRDIGYLPQQTEAQRDFPASVREIVRSGFLSRTGLRPFYTGYEKKQAEDCLKTLGISELAGRSYSELSGGQQQRVLLARALCAGRKLLVLDEPSSGLDPSASVDMYRFIKDSNDRGMTIIMVSHDAKASVKYASHILHIGGHSMLFYGTKAEYLNSEIGQAYVGFGGETP